jgi:hypothetical protein
VNAFLDLADRQAPAPVKARVRAAETRRSKRGQQRDTEQRQLSAHYRWHRQQALERTLAGPDGARLRALLDRLKALTLKTIETLIPLATDWRAAAPDARFLAQRLIAERIIELREQGGLMPLNDPLPGEPATPEWQVHLVFADHQTGD